MGAYRNPRIAIAQPKRLPIKLSSRYTTVSPMLNHVRGTNYDLISGQDDVGQCTLCAIKSMSEAWANP